MGQELGLYDPAMLDSVGLKLSYNRVRKWIKANTATGAREARLCGPGCIGSQHQDGSQWANRCRVVWRPGASSERREDQRAKRDGLFSRRMERQACLDLHVRLGDARLNMKTTNLCPRCKSRSRWINSNGNIYGYCQPCKREVDKTYLSRHKKEIKGRRRRYYEANKEVLLAKQKEDRKKNAEKIKERSLEWRNKNRDKLRKSYKAYYEANKEKILSKPQTYPKTPKGKKSAAKRALKNYYKNHEENKNYGKAKQSKYREKLSDSYIKSLFKIKHVPPILIETKRAQLMLHRLIQSHAINK